jgi:hypothetical protein
MADQAPALDQLRPGPAETTTNSITPPNSADGKKHTPDGLPSELSDLELDNHNKPAPSIEAVEEDIEPDHYYDGGQIPVFKPVSRFQEKEKAEIDDCRPWTSFATFRRLSARLTSTE